MNYDITMEKYPHLFIMTGAGLIAILLWAPLFSALIIPTHAPSIPLMFLYINAWSRIFKSGSTIVMVLLLSLIIGMIISSIEYNMLRKLFRNIIVKRTAYLLGFRKKWDAAGEILNKIRWEQDEEHFLRQMWLGEHPAARRDRDWDWFLSKSHELLAFIIFNTPVLIFITWLISRWIVPISIKGSGWIVIIAAFLVYLGLIPGYVKYAYDRALTDFAIYHQFKKEQGDKN